MRLWLWCGLKQRVLCACFFSWCFNFYFWMCTRISFNQINVTANVFWLRVLALQIQYRETLKFSSNQNIFGYSEIFLTWMLFSFQSPSYCDLFRFIVLPFISLFKALNSDSSSLAVVSSRNYLVWFFLH